MRIPEFLKEEGCLGFVAPAFGCNIEPYQSGFKNALKKFKDMGFPSISFALTCTSFSR